MKIGSKRAYGLLVFITVMMTLISCKELDQDSYVTVPAELTNDETNRISDSDEASHNQADTSDSAKTNKLALYNCTIIDGTGAVIDNGVVLLTEDRIDLVGTSEDIVIPEDYMKIDLNKNTVLPGFINTHVHNAYSETNRKNWLKGGVTTIRDLGANPSVDVITKRDVNNKRSDVARIVSATSMLTVPDGYGSDYFTSAKEAADIVNSYINKGIDVIKFSIEDYQQGKGWKMPTDEELQVIVDTAHAGGKKAVVHLTHAKFLEQAAELGVDQIGHMVVEKIDEDICRLLIEKGIYWIPTLELWKGVSGIHSVRYSEIAVENLGIFYQTGGTIALGTDFAGYYCDFDQGFPITEVKLMREAGMSNMDIILAGTKNAAEACDHAEILGTIEEGKIADLLIVEGDPLERIEDLQNTYMVIHNGKIVDLE